ncbi:hypothetical protein JXB37_06915 [candidate division WOR-3 bacterium]|nr:hypothetical protein [candidate division WOR-3 bacterium]
MSPHSPDIIFYTGNVYSGAYYLAVCHTTDGGATWPRDTLTLGTRGWAIAFDPADSNRVYVGGDSAYSYPALLVTTDLGETWTQSRTGLAGAVYALATVPGNPQVIFAGTTSGVYKSTDRGATWTSTGMSNNTKALVVEPGNPNTVYAGTYGQGVHVTTDAGGTWTPMNDGLDNLKVLALDLRPGSEPVLFAGTEGGGVFRTELFTGIAERPGRARGIGGPTFIRATLELPGSRPAVLHDAAGRAVMALAPGENDVRQLPAGLYFIRPVEAGRAAVRKVVIQ